MSDDIINLQSWLQTPPAKALLSWEQAQFDALVADVFGYHALQLGWSQLDTLQNNRISQRWLASTDSQPATSKHLVLEPEALPFAENSLDLLTLPHTLEFCADAHTSLREAARVLVPEGRIIVTGFNPQSLWGFKQSRVKFYQQMGFGQPYLPSEGQMISPQRLRDWLRLLGFEVESIRYGIWQSAVRSQAALDRTAWMNAWGAKYWPIFGAVYSISAVKRVRGMRLVGKTWKKSGFRVPAPAAPATFTPNTLESVTKIGH